jgi:hypothetical protein
MALFETDDPERVTGNPEVERRRQLLFWITSGWPTNRELFALRRFSLAMARIFALLLVVAADSLEGYSIHLPLGWTIPI